ncbi:hypothetical protein FF38_07163 [Lucilia cuprina]|uniref:Uncharacterized protein n=1 Tax=Lucilia cuprina TaxID=7375 RepID=A0A0L0CL08_LUCCU|nr:hypothetical protein FF38_07163 [Lucilia cuprina]
MYDETYITATTIDTVEQCERAYSNPESFGSYKVDFFSQVNLCQIRQTLPYYEVSQSYINRKASSDGLVVQSPGYKPSIELSYMNRKASSDEPVVQSPGSQPSIEDISPPPIQFKRQKCVRFKRHNRISLPVQPSAPSHSANEHSHTSPMDTYRRSDYRID